MELMVIFSLNSCRQRQIKGQISMVVLQKIGSALFWRSSTLLGFAFTFV